MRDRTKSAAQVQEISQRFETRIERGEIVLVLDFRGRERPEFVMQDLARLAVLATNK